MNNTDIIPMKAERDELGEIRYTQDEAPSARPAKLTRLSGWPAIGLGVAFFLLFLTVFVYVIVPLAAIFFLVALIRGLFRRR